VSRLDVQPQRRSGAEGGRVARRLLPVVWCACALWSGCARFEPKPLSPAVNAAALDNRTLGNPALKPLLERNLHRSFAVWPPASWDFEMLSLAAFYYHPDLEVARTQWKAAQAGITTAAARPNPAVSLIPGYNFSHINAAYGLSPWIPVADFDLPIETAGKRRHRIAQATNLSETARLNVLSTAWQVRSTLRATLLDFTVAQQRRSLLQKQVSIQEQIVKLLVGQVQAGAIASSELATFRIALAKGQLDLADAQLQVVQSRARVAQSIGIPVKALDSTGISFDLLNDPEAAARLSSAEIRHQALLGRSDILEALADYAAAQSALQVEIARQYPDVHLSPSYQFDQGDNKWSLGITIQVPLLDRNQGPIAQAKARREEAAARFNALQAKVLADIDGAVEGFRVTQKNLALLRTLAEEQANYRDSVAAQLKAGAAAPLDLLNAQFEYAVAQAGQLDGRWKLQQSLAALEDAVQRPIEPMNSFQP
jgi:outer membrane protein TolC